MPVRAIARGWVDSADGWTLAMHRLEDPLIGEVVGAGGGAGAAFLKTIWRRLARLHGNGHHANAPAPEWP